MIYGSGVEGWSSQSFVSVGKEFPFKKYRNVSSTGQNMQRILFLGSRTRFLWCVKVPVQKEKNSSLCPEFFRNSVEDQVWLHSVSPLHISGEIPGRVNVFHLNGAEAAQTQLAAEKIRSLQPDATTHGGSSGGSRGGDGVELSLWHAAAPRVSQSLTKQQQRRAGQEVESIQVSQRPTEG